MAATKPKKRPNCFVKTTAYRQSLVEKTRNSVSVAQAFQPVSRKQVSRAQPGKAVPPVNTNLFMFYGWTKGPGATALNAPFTPDLLPALTAPAVTRPAGAPGGIL